MSDKKSESGTTEGRSLSRREALKKLGLGTAAFVVPLVATVSEAEAKRSKRSSRSYGTGSSYSESYSSSSSYNSKRSSRSHGTRSSDDGDNTISASP